LIATKVEIISQYEEEYDEDKYSEYEKLYDDLPKVEKIR